MTNFPTSLDDATSIPVESAGTALSTNHVTNHQNVQDAIEAIEAKIGVDGSAVTTSHDYKLSGVTGTDKAASLTGAEALTNKTLTAPTITSPKVTVGSDAVGDLHYVSNVDGTQSRLALGTNGYILKSNGTNPVWGAETTTVNADQTTAGIVEEATAAEITAGTATGGTGASLYVSPDQLALSTPVFDGSGLTNIPRFLAGSGTDVVNDNSAAEETMLTYSLAGGILSTNKGVRVRGVLRYSNDSSTANCTFKIKYGGTTLATFSDPNSSITNITGDHIFDFLLIGGGTTGTQEASCMVMSKGASASCPISQCDFQVSSIDSTTAQDIVITSQISSAASGRTATLKHYFIEKIV